MSSNEGSAPLLGQPSHLVLAAVGERRGERSGRQLILGLQRSAAHRFGRRFKEDVTACSSLAQLPSHSTPGTLATPSSQRASIIISLQDCGPVRGGHGRSCTRRERHGCSSGRSPMASQCSNIGEPRSSPQLDAAAVTGGDHWASLGGSCTTAGRERDGNTDGGP